MTSVELTKTIDWLREYVNRMKDREDYDILEPNIRALEATIRELEDKAYVL